MILILLIYLVGAILHFVYLSKFFAELYAKLEAGAKLNDEELETIRLVKEASPFVSVNPLVIVLSVLWFPLFILRFFKSKEAEDV